ncbi:hypothetical protein ACSDQ9_13765 [Aestuariimicrobium soli]|uniref:hypothetical protein n=1 Tax=Aestuariimicrobium soli TaxID=2035834 RepID=UPI003EBBE2E2
MTTRRVRPVAVLVAVAAMLAAGWLTTWRENDPPLEQLTARPNQEVVINHVGQSVRFMQLELGQVYTNDRQAQATAARYLQVTVRLTTPRERSMVSFDCEAEQGGQSYQPIGLGRTLFPEPGQRNLASIAFEFDPSRAASLRIVCRERSTITFRETTVTYDPQLGTEAGRRLLAQSAGALVVEGEQSTEPIQR